MRELNPLLRIRDDFFSLSLSDGKENIVTHPILFSDFPFDKATIWIVDDCIILPHEF